MARLVRRTSRKIDFSEFGLPDRTLPPPETLTSRSGRVPSSEDLRKADVTSYLFDVFLDRLDRVVLLGPPIFDLWQTGRPQGARIVVPETGLELDLDLVWQKNNRRLLYYVAETAQAAIPRDHAVFVDLTVNGVTVRRPLERFFATGSRVIATLQKDHVPAHVLDWIAYYRKLGVDEFLIYDNASANVEDLAAAIAASEGDHVVQIVDWPYLYGLGWVGRVRYCQNGILNHALAAAKQSDWLLNFDIDEYLALDRYEDSLSALFAAWPDESGFVFDGFRVPVPLDFDIERPYGAADFTARKIAGQGRAWKYITRPPVTRFVNIHTIHHEEGKSQRAVPNDEAYFLHFMGLTSGTPEKIVARLHEREPVPASELTETATVPRVMGRGGDR